MKRISIYLLTFALIFTARTTQAQVRSGGYIDTTFLAPCLSGASSLTTRALAVQPDGRILAGGTYTTGNSCVNGLVRLQINGGTDLSFTSPFIAGDQVNALARQSDGQILVGGNLRAFGTVSSLARLNSNGSYDSTFTRALTGIFVAINALAIQSDEHIIAAGYDFSTLGSTPGRVYRLNKNGGADATFAPGLTGFSGNGQGITAVALQSGKIILGGSFTSYTALTLPSTPSIPCDGLVRLNANGTIDPTFNPLVHNSEIYALLVQPDQKILVAGTFAIGGLQGVSLIRLLADGTQDLSFIPSGGPSSVGLSLALQPDGKVLLGHSAGVVRLLSNGQIDTTFGPLNAFNSYGTEALSTRAVTLALDNKVLVGATRVTVGTTERRGVTRLWNDIPPRPFIVQQPLTQVVPAGSNATFSIIVTGAPPILFQWRKNGVNIKGATGSSLLLTNVHSPATANYTVVATNVGGAVTSAVARLIVDFQTSPLSLVVNGTGIVTPNLNGQELEIGLAYTLTAKPAVGNLFSNWTGSITSSAPVLNFVMQSNFMLQANFVPSPFLPVKGTYNGLFYDLLAPAQESAGAIILTLDEKGRVQGTIRQGSKSRKVSGTFSLERTVTLTLPATSTLPAVSIVLVLDIAQQAITGSSLIGTQDAEVFASRNPFSSSANPAPLAGKYNTLLPGVADAAVAPAGDGFVALTVSTSGRVSGPFNLADGTVVNLVSGVDALGRTPVYLSLSGGRGSLFGWLTVTNGGGNDVSGTLWWTKPGRAGVTYYPVGFTNSQAVAGSRFVAPASGIPVLVLTNGVVILHGGNLLGSITDAVTLGGDNKITGDNGLSITFSRTKGSFTGSFVDPDSGKKRTLNGLVLPNQNRAGGFFLGTSESGNVFVGEQP